MLDSFGDDVGGSTHCITDWCLDAVVPVKTVQGLANNKPWVTSEVNAALNRMKRAFKNKDPEEMRRAWRKLKICMKEAEDSYRMKLERKPQACGRSGGG